MFWESLSRLDTLLIFVCDSYLYNIRIVKSTSFVFCAYIQAGEASLSWRSVTVVMLTDFHYRIRRIGVLGHISAAAGRPAIRTWLLGEVE